MGKLLCLKCAIVWLNNKICLTNRKNHLSPSTRRSPGSESSRKVCAAYFLCHCCQMKWFFRTCGESLPISFHSSIPLLELTLVLQITESKDSSIIFMKIGRRSNRPFRCLDCPRCKQTWLKPPNRHNLAKSVGVDQVPEGIKNNLYKNWSFGHHLIVLFLLPPKLQRRGLVF